MLWHWAYLGFLSDKTQAHIRLHFAEKIKIKRCVLRSTNAARCLQFQLSGSKVNAK